MIVGLRGQYKDKTYRRELEQMGIETILELGLAFAGKRVWYCKSE